MNDYELQKLILQKYYERRRTGGYYKAKPNEFDFEIDENEIERIELALHDQKFIEGIIRISTQKRFFNSGRILPKGISNIENESLNRNNPVFNTTNISNSQDFQIGNYNTLNITNEFEINYNKLLEKIDNSNETQEKKLKAKEYLKKLLVF